MENTTTPSATTNEKKEKSKHKNLKFFLSAIGLVLAFALILDNLSALLVHPEDNRSHSMIGCFYQEEKNSLDAVFIGSSTTYADWNPMIAWNNYGFTAYSMTSPAQPLFAAKNLCIEARKTQPDALYVFNLVTLCEYFDDDQFFANHALIDYMPFSWNRIMLSKALCDNMDYKYSENLEYFFPIVRYHDQWENWNGKKYHLNYDGVKGVAHYGSWLRRRKDTTEIYNYTDKVADFKPEHSKIRDCVNDLLDYLKKENVKALFIATPTNGKEQFVYEYINKACEMAEEAGFPILNMQGREALDEIGIDLTRDFYNLNHLNVHGSIKITKYLSEYMVKNYGFKNKKNDKNYSAAESWNKAYKKYINYLKPFSLEQEYNLKTDNHFFCPKIFAEDMGGGKVYLHWKPADGADGYAIYKKDGDKVPYQLVTEGELSELSFTDTCTGGKTYTYVVVAYKGKGDGRIWSTYYGKGEEITL